MLFYLEISNLFKHLLVWFKYFAFTKHKIQENAATIWIIWLCICLYISNVTRIYLVKFTDKNVELYLKINYAVDVY